MPAKCTQIVIVLFLLLSTCLNAQVVINEGANKNYLIGIDEDAENEDWIELYNAGATTIDLSRYTLSDKLSEPTLWPLTGLSLEPNSFLQI